MGMRLLKTLLVMLAGLVGGYLAALGVGLAAFDVFEVSQFEGANAMGLAFFICPMVAVVSALVAGIWYWIVSGRRNPETRAAPGAKIRIAWVVVAAVGGWLAGLLLQWLLAGRSYETYVVALAVSLASWLGAIGLAAAAWWMQRRD
ncbi:hypothetical protein NBH19_02955 [Rhizobium sp. S95]|uniref:Uncharacterized protein n=1 Tax=Ciceribacter sichuanensis TaxID=2949647 RepID=A0AAJ1FGZ5_9HYPH|nr:MULTISPECIES: hypothetical protein [unclassified Ciceribacter]MCM2395039.1 hypothetical protein [Ciceribacter sp. S95]MCO5955461.1 hypothetical protein [Ciceribacter sp. S101]